VNHQNALIAEVGMTIERLIKETAFGSLLLVVQDARVVQVERNEKFQFPAPRRAAAEMPRELSVSENNTLSRIIGALSALDFGQVVVKIQEGRVVQIDRTEKFRLPELDGMYGDGI